MPRERRIFKVLPKKSETVSEPEPKAKSLLKVERESANRPTQEKKLEPTEYLRQNPTESEMFIREKLTEQKIKFNFRLKIHWFVPSFYFPKYKKAIELDEKLFNDKEEKSRRRKAFKKHGIPMLFINPERVIRKTDRVMEEIISFLTGKPIKPHSKKTKSKVHSNPSKTPEKYIHSPELTISELSERLRDESYLESTLKKLKG